MAKLRGCTCILADSDDYNTNGHKRVKSNTTPDDRLSALPDFLILHILSFLSTEEVVKTCLLSKRWQFIWTGISKVDLSVHSSDPAKIRRFVDLVGRMVVMCRGLNKFAVNLNYEKCFASNVDFWVECVVKNKVKDITLICRGDDYELPQMLYSYSSLTNLTLYSCDLAPRGAIEWGSLKSLSIEGVKLLDCVMEKILGCPVLEILNLQECWGFDCLNICSPNLTTLVLVDFEDFGNEFVEILAPYLLDLSITEHVKGMRFGLKNVSSVVRANLEFVGLANDERDVYTSPNTMIYINQLFQSLQSVKELELGLQCIEV
ncbi:hypothetical protein RD792_014698 [Penstemon davidsonii]|uniref:F-box domain-containing protein n=1 Tax=Penstemon davidsonii TaxID=160366 RepID=A0ABR0CQ05_9LAMI|nr:hypothetical protein RD792_014698 [Penstemon davidsonii]